MAFSRGDCGAPRQVTVPARDIGVLVRGIEKAKRRFGLPEDACVVSCYEAGRDGFWLHRFLVSIGADNLVVDSSSIEVNRRARRAKTDRLDVTKLLKLLIRHHGGEAKVWSVLRVPSLEVEDERRVHREVERLQKERTAHSNRMRALLAAQGIVMKVDRTFSVKMTEVRRWDNSRLDHNLEQELLREYQRWEMVDRQLHDLAKEQSTALRSEESGTAGNRLEQVRQLAELRGIGRAIAWSLVHEFLWRDFNNRREVGGASGLTGTPYDSGDSAREQGISKAGNRRVRRVLIEAAWLWVRWQPDSEITRWFERRFAHGAKRMRRVGIVAVARRLLIALWRYLKDGVVPEGAVFGGSPATA